MEKIQLGTPDGTAENVDRLAELFPQAVTEVEADDGSITRAIDFDALRDLLGDVAEGTRERYQFTWPGKAEAKAEARRPIAKTMRPEKGKSKDWDTTQNLYIEGDNLDALKILKETYAGKVKLIYIDPPYNTGHDFVYDDDFAKTRGEYTLESGDYDEDGGRLVANTEGNGRFHSDWCSMMYPRLILARELLHSRGCICISIDDNEVCALKSICNEIFGERSFVCTIPRQARASVQNDTDISVNHEYILIYARCRRQTNRRLKESNASDWMLDKSFACYPKTSDESRYANPDNDPRGPWKADPFDAPNVRPNLTYPIVNPNTGEAHLPPSGRCWRTEPEKYQQLLSDGRIIFGASGKKRPQLKVFLEEKRDYGEVDNTWWDASRIQTNAGASKDLMKLFDGELPFNTPKPVSLILNLINLGLPPDSEDIVLDFFSGSASTAHAVMLENSLKKKRIRYILIQLPEPHDGSFNSLCDVGEERIRRAGEKIRAKVEESNRKLKIGEEPKRVPDIGFRVLRIDSSNMRDMLATPEETTQEGLFDSADNVKEGRTDEDLLFEVLPKFRIPYSARIKERTIAGKRCMVVEDGLLVACFDTNVGVDTIEAIAKMEPVYAVMRDASMADDATHANFEELFRTYSPDTVRRVV